MRFRGFTFFVVVFTRVFRALGKHKTVFIINHIDVNAR